MQQWLMNIPANYWGIAAIAAGIAVFRFWPAIGGMFKGVKMPSLGGGKMTRDDGVAAFNRAYAYLEETKCEAGMKAMRDALPHFYHPAGEHA